MFFPDSKIFFQLGPFRFTWYALLIMVGALIAYEISKRNLLKAGYNVDDIDNVFIGSLVFGFLGARLWYVMFSNLSYYIQNPFSILAIWEGGLAIQGGLIGGSLFCYVYMKKARINFMQAADLIVPNILLAQALGRWGNFFNQEAYGNPVTEAFMQNFPAFIREGMLINGTYYHPTFLYESILNVVGWILIVLVLKRTSKLKRGDLAYAYLMWYGVTRFFIEGLRTDSLMFFGLRMAQITSIVFIVVGLMGYFGVFRKITKEVKPVILWDFDGTIANSEPVILETFNTLFKTYKPKVEVDESMISKMIGQPLEDIMFDYYPGNHDVMIEKYRSIQEPLIKSKLVEMEGASALLSKLKEDGYRMGVVSNRSQASLEYALEVLKMRDYFEVIVGSDRVKETKPHPEGINKALAAMGVDKGAVIYVGDTSIDVEAGKRAGSFTISCIFDTIRENEIVSSKPNRIVRSLYEINEVLEEDLQWTTTMM